MSKQRAKRPSVGKKSVGGAGKEAFRTRPQNPQYLRKGGRTLDSVNQRGGIPPSQFTAEESDGWGIYSESIKRAFRRCQGKPGVNSLRGADLPTAPERNLPIPTAPLSNQEVSKDQRKLQRQMEFINEDGSMRALSLYMRVSQEEQSDLSLEAQFSVMVDFCVSQQIEIRGIYWDKKSGKNYLRPGFGRMIKDIWGGLADGMLVVRMDRFGRFWFGGICVLWTAWLKDRPLYFPEYDCFPIQLHPAAMGMPGARMKAVGLLDQAEGRNHNKGNQIKASNRKSWTRGLMPNGWSGRLPFIEVKTNGKMGKKKQRWAELSPNARHEWWEITERLIKNPTWTEFRKLAKELDLGDPKSLVIYLRMHYVMGTWSDPSMQWVCPDPWGAAPLVTEDEWNELQDALDGVELDRDREAKIRADKQSRYEVQVQDASLSIVMEHLGSIEAKFYCKHSHELFFKTKQSKGHDWADWMWCNECNRGFLLITRAQREKIQLAFEKGGGWGVLTGLTAILPKKFRKDPETAKIVADILLNCGVEAHVVKGWLRRCLRPSRKGDRIKRARGGGSSILGEFS